MPNLAPVIFGGSVHERVAIEVRGYSYPTNTDPDDGNWLNSKVSVAAGGFRGGFECSLRTEDFVSLDSGLTGLDENPRGSVAFETMEGQLSFTVKGDGLGHYEVSGTAIDQPGIGNRLSWRIEIDQAQLSAIVDEVRAIVLRLPVRGV